MINHSLGIRLLFFVVALFILLTPPLSAQVVGQGLGTSKASPKVPKEIKREQKKEREEALPTDRVIELLSTMTLEEKIAQIMFVRIVGELAPNTADTNLIRHIPPGGLVIPGLNRATTMIDYSQVIHRMTGDAKNPIPFFIAGDAFAQVDSMKKGSGRFMPMPTRLALGASGKSVDRLELFDRLADSLSRVGLNTHFGPSLAMSNTFGVGSSSLYTFGNSPTMTADIARELGESFKKHDIIWIPQGFPAGEPIVREKAMLC